MVSCMDAQHPDNPAALPTLREVLELPVVRAGAPEVLAGSPRLATTIRWAHVSELADIGPLLRGGELVLSTGIGLSDDPDALAQYVAGLVAAGAGGLIIELGRRFTALPFGLVQAAQAWELPLIAMHREVRFVEITEAVHARILDAQVARLHRSERIHQRFTQLSVQAASAHTIVAAAAEHCGTPVVLEDLAHRVLADAGTDHHPAGVAAPVEDASPLADWQRRSRAVRDAPATVQVAPGEVWTVVPVGARGQRWGRLVAVGTEVVEDTARVLERAAAALAINRLSERDELATRIRADQAVLASLADGSYRSEEAIDARASALGVPLHGRQLVGVSVMLHETAEPPAARRSEPRAAQRLEQDDLERVLAAARGVLAVLAESPGPGEVRLLASLPDDADPARALATFARALHRQPPRGSRQATVGVGSVVRALPEVARSLSEASHVAAAAPAAGRRKAYYELWDVRVRGLIHVLRDDPRLQHFIDRELGALLRHDAARGSTLLATLETYLDQGRNKARTAAALHLSRPALYARLGVIARVLDADLDDPEVCLSLHVAVLGLRSLRR